jgi:tungstate transport system ATP-binding protein
MSGLAVPAHATDVSTPSTLFTLRGVGVTFGAHAALSDIDLHVRQGERVALIGANGCGKSTLLRVLHGLLVPTRGQVQQSRPLRQAMLFQRPHMLRTQSWRHVALGLWLKGQPWRQARERAHEALERVGLLAVAQQPAHTLSGGQQQRLALARAWVLEPELWLLDEPTASLDPHAKREVEGLVQEVVSAVHLEPAVTLIFSSHNLGQVKRLASRVIYLEGGRILADLPTDVFFQGPLERTHPQAHLFVKGETV